jgi:hypothetical protein
MTYGLLEGSLLAQVSFSAGTHYVQDFNSLASSGTSSVLPTGWSLYQSAGSSYTADNGASSTRQLCSYGAAGSSERALGSIGGNSSDLIVGARLIASGSTPITQLSISYFGEQWRNLDSNPDSLQFQYSVNATSLTTGTWTGISSLDFTSPNTSTQGALNGNDAANRTFESGIISGLNLQDGQELWIRWVNYNPHAHKDDGLAIDDVSITAVPEPTEFGLVAVLGLLAWSVKYRFFNGAAPAE